MQPLTTPEPPSEILIELSPHSRLPRLDLGVEWESPWKEFRTSALDFFKGPRPLKGSGESTNSLLRVYWVRGRLSGWALVASTLWHIAVVLILLLPIWSLLPSTKSTDLPPQIELTWYAPAQDLPPISLPGPRSKPSPPGDPSKPLAHRGADAFHPRQTILSTPVRVTHPRQTLIQPDASPAPPKIEPQLPNIVEWAATAPQPKLQLRISPTAAAPKMRKRTSGDMAAPEVANLEKNSGPLNITPTPVVNAEPQMPVSPMSAAVPEHRQAREDSTAAPEIGATESSGDASLHRIIALSANPAPPAPEVGVPNGNLSARVAISPEGTESGVPGGAENGTASHGGTGGNSNSMGGTNGASGAANGSGGSGNGSSLPAAVSVSGGNASHSSSGGVAGAGNHSTGRFTLKPLAPLTSPPDPAASHRGPVDVAHLDPGLPPEKILSGKEIYTLHVNMPNLSSVTGSWVLNCAQLDEGEGPIGKPKGTLSGPVPVEKADPKYPQSLIKEHVDGEVVLYAIIRKDGSVDSIQLVRGLDPQLDRYAMEAFARWKFRPGTRAGAPIDVEAVVHIPFHFRISPDY